MKNDWYELDQDIRGVEHSFAPKPSIEVGGFRALLSKVAAPGAPAPDKDLVEHEQKIVAGEEPLPAEAQAAQAAGAPDVTGHFEGEFAVPVEQVVMTLSQIVSNSMRQHMAYAYYGEMMRGLGRGELAELFDEQAKDELEEMSYFLRRMSVLQPGGAMVPPASTPQPSSDPRAALEYLIAGEQQAIVLFKSLHAQLGDNPMKFTLEELQSHAQEHLDKLWQYMPDEEASAPAQTTPAKVAGVLVRAALKRANAVPPPGAEPIESYLAREQQLDAAQSEAEKQELAARLEEMTAHANTQQAQAEQANMTAQQASQQAELAGQQAAVAQEQAMASAEAAAAATTQAAAQADGKMRLSMRIQQLRQDLMNLASQDPVAEEGMSHGGEAGPGAPMTPLQQQDHAMALEEEQAAAAMDPTGGTGEIPTAGAAQQQGEAVKAQDEAKKQTAQAQEKTKADTAKKESKGDKPGTTISVKTAERRFSDVRFQVGAVSLPFKGGI